MDIDIKELKKGVRAAQIKLVDTYKDFVYSIARRMLRQEVLAEEAVQQVFIKVFQNIGQFKEQSKFSTWIYTISFRTCLNLQGASKNLRMHETLDEEIHGAEIGEFSSVGMADNGAFDDTGEILWRVVDQLNQPQGIILTLFYLNGLSIDEIASMMQISDNTVKTHLFRGRKRLKQLLLRNYAIEDLI